MGVLLLSSCSAKHADPPIIDLGEIEDIRFRHIQEFILEKHCKECHDGDQSSSDIDLSNYDKVLNEFIVPFDAENSIFYLELVDNSMPEDRTPLTAQEKALVREWIDSGALP